MNNGNLSPNGTENEITTDGIDDDEKVYPQIQVTSKKSLRTARILWLLGGVFGLHHYYLRRTEQAIVWFCTFGGFFATGWIFDYGKLPSYVMEANEDPKFVKKFRDRLKSQPFPKFSIRRLFFGMFVGSFFARVWHDAVPGVEVYGIKWDFLHLLAPLACAIGVWLVGNIGREQGILKHSVIVAYLTTPVKFFVEDLKSQHNTMAFCSSLAFILFSKKWRRNPPKRQGAIKTALIISTAACIYLSVWGSFFVFNFKFTNDFGDEVKLYDVLRNIIRSDVWTELKKNAWATVEFSWRYGPFETWKHLKGSLDMYGEMNAYKDLGLTPKCTLSDVKSAFRKLSLEYHPDKVKESQKELAQEKFMELQKSYEILSKIKSQKKPKPSLNDLFKSEFRDTNEFDDEF